MIEYRHEPYAHQAQELSAHWAAPGRALPWSMRTGKSMVPVLSAAALWQTDQVDAVIVVAPNRVHHAWALDEFPRHCAVPFLAHSWTCSEDRNEDAREKLAELFTTDALAVLAVNKEAMLVQRVWKTVRKFATRKRCMLVVDESHHFGGPGTKGTKRLRALAERCPFRRILSGTMVGNSPGRVYSQFQLLQKGALGYQTAEDFLKAHGVFTWDGGHWRLEKNQWRDLELLRERMARWGRPVLRSDCEDLPALVTSRQYLDLPEDAQRAHDEAMEEGKLQDPPQYMGARRAALEGKGAALLDALPDLFEEGPAVVVWAPFRDVVEEVSTELTRAKVESFPHHGGHPRDRRDRALRWFKRGEGFEKKPDSPRVLVSTPDSLAEGMDLSVARSMVWYAPPWDSIMFGQAGERCTAMGGASTVVLELCSRGTVEEAMYAGLRRKVDLADWLGGEGLRDWMKGKGTW